MKCITCILLSLILTLFVVFAEGNIDASVQKNEENAKLLSYAKYYGIDEGIKKVNTPRTLDEYKNHILYSVLTGDLTPEIKFSSREIGEKLNDQLNYQYEKDKSGFDIMTDMYVEALSYYYFGGFSYREREDNVGNFYLERTVESEKALPNEKTFFNRQTQAIKSLIELCRSFHSQGLITDEMSQYDVLGFYLDYVYDATRDLPYSDDLSIMDIIESKSKNRINLISYFNILLRIEGMQVQSLMVNNSLTSRVLADGYIYYVNLDNFTLFSKNSVTTESYYPLFFDGENNDVIIKTKKTESSFLTSTRTTPDVFTEPWYEKYARTKITTLDLWGLSEELGPAT